MEKNHLVDDIDAMRTSHITFLMLYCSSLTAFQKVDINEASIEQIALLPSIGEGLALKIVSFRLMHKGIAGNAELSQVPGMTKKKLEAIMPHVIFSSKKLKKRESKEEPLVPITLKPIIPLKELERAVINHFDLQESFEIDMQERVRHAAWLPRLGLAFDIDRDLDLSHRNSKKADLIQKRGFDISFAVRASFDLPALVFNKDELDVARFRQKRIEIRQEVLKKIQDLYFTYIRLTQNYAQSTEPKSIKNREISLLEIASSIDSLSARAFSNFQEKNVGSP